MNDDEQLFYDELILLRSILNTPEGHVYAIYEDGEFEILELTN